MLSTRIEKAVDANRDPVVVLAADEKFAMPLAVTVRSVLENLSPDRKLRIYVLDGGLSDASKLRVEKSWPKGRYQIHWVVVDSSAVKNLPMAGANHVNHVCYYRILMPLLLPEVERAIHLDADMLVCADLGRLWDHELEGRLCWAVQDCAAPYMDAQVALANFDSCRRYLESAEPVPNYRELGLDPRAPYFNAGLLYADFAAWRNVDLPGQLLACLEQNRQHVKWNDQYALNVVLAGRWGQLDVRWNQGTHIFGYPTWSQSPFDRETFEKMRDDPYLIHFTTRDKPWVVPCLHPSRKLFYEYLDRTAWAGWRPSVYSHLRAAFNRLKAHQRRFRSVRRRLQSRAFGWVYQHCRLVTR